VVAACINVHQVDAQAGAQYPGTKDGVQRFYSSDGGYSPTGCQISNCDASKCAPNQYLFNCGGNSGGECTTCSNTKPDNSDWQSGTTGGFSATGCKWVCSTNFKLNAAGNGCEAQACSTDLGKSAIANSDFVPGLNGGAPNCYYQCKAGYVSSTDVPVTARGPGRCDACTAGQTSIAGQACTDCGPGLFSAVSASPTCSECKSSEQKYSTGQKNTQCQLCTSCGQGEYRTGCGGSQGPGTCPSCTNTNWP
jgi:hypothetical protein